MKTGIIGAGASGLMAAVTAAGNGASVTVFERNDKTGRKLLVTGNGRCNYTNTLMNAGCYNENAGDFVSRALGIFDEKDAIEFFRRAGMLTKYKNGYAYPYSEQAQAVQDIFIMECRRLNVRIEKGVRIDSINSKRNGFVIGADGRKEYFDKIILACGGMASPKSGTDGSGYTLAENFGHSIKKPVPSLVQLKCQEKFFKELSGIRCECEVSFLIDGAAAGTEKGEVQFTDYGLSGIPVFQFSGKAARALAEGKKCRASIDFMPELSVKETIGMLLERKNHAGDKTITEFMIGLFNWNLNKVIIKRAGIPADTLASKLKKTDLEIIAGYIKEFEVQITGTNGFDRAQVTSGGINISEINPETMESKLKRGLYFAGEIMDVDGRCGGYNLQWAWTSGYISGKAASYD